MKLIFILSAILLHSRVETIEPAVDPLGIFIQTNFAGFPVYHAQQTWIFDPDLGLRRRREFVKLNGDKGENLIERLGLGIDGREDERLLQQSLRDKGHLGDYHKSQSPNPAQTLHSINVKTDESQLTASAQTSDRKNYCFTNASWWSTCWSFQAEGCNKLNEYHSYLTIGIKGTVTPR